jgi:hypothetical protein
MKVRDDLVRIIDDVLGDDPRAALIACARLTDDELPWLEQRVVALARREGWNWATIGRLLRRTRQTVRQRFDGVPLAKRHDPHLAYNRGEAEFARLRNDFQRQADDDPIAW